jgi:hypothetical protein
MANVHGDKIERIILSEAISTTGKYYIFFGQHMVGGFPCYDICVVVRTSEAGGRVLAKHRPQVMDEHAREHTLVEWESFRERMTAPRGESEADEPSDPMELIN